MDLVNFGLFAGGLVGTGHLALVAACADGQKKEIGTADGTCSSVLGFLIQTLYTLEVKDY